jgi:hypothetical protein
LLCHTNLNGNNDQSSKKGSSTLKKTLLITSALFVVLSSGCQAALTEAASITSVQSAKSKVSLTDIATHWAKESIMKAVDKQYVDGYEDTTFRPEQNVSRAEFLKMVVTAMKLPVSGDATGSDWYEPVAAASRLKGLLRESDFPVADINKPISRLEMARISLRATDATLQNKALHIDDYSVMYNGTKAGLIQGLSYGELGPDKPTTRAQSVTIIERILTVNDGGKLPVDKYAVSNAELALKKTNIFSMIPKIFGGKQIEGGSYVLWDPSNLVIETPDGKFKGSIDQIIAIDMADPNDPNRGLLGDINKLGWSTGSYKGVKPLVKDYPDSYIILIKTHVDENKDEEIYSSELGVRVGLYGFVNQDKEAKWKGVLNTSTTVGPLPQGMQGFIIPKSGYKTDLISLTIEAPARPPHADYHRNILTTVPTD